jgi:putative membrane protein insertion efficiency factor
MSTWAARLLIAFVRGYRLLLSPWLGNACRFEPTCSVYSIEALSRHGALAGVALTIGRVARCHPWCDGGLDPVPAESPHLFSSLLVRQETRAPSASSDVSDPASS